MHLPATERTLLHVLHGHVAAVLALVSGAMISLGQHQVMHPPFLQQPQRVGQTKGACASLRCNCDDLFDQGGLLLLCHLPGNVQRALSHLGGRGSHVHSKTPHDLFLQ